jgi:DNA-binding protein HU-beta
MSSEREVQKGQEVSIGRAGVFEKRRVARTPRNPRTREQVMDKRRTVPVFRPGKYLKDVNAGTVKLSNSNITSRLAAAYPMKDRYAGTSVGRSTRLGPG